MRIVRFGMAVTLLALLAACGSNNSSTPTSPTGNGTPVTIVKGAQSLTTTAYNPNPLTINAGTMVTWTNSDSIAHTATSDNGTFSSGTINAGASFSFTFPTKGTFTYHCSIHPGMVGTINVQ